MSLIPNTSQLDQIHADIDHAIDAVTGVLDFVEKYGQFIPGASAALPIVKDLDSVLKTVKAFLDKVPA